MAAPSTEFKAVQSPVVHTSPGYERPVEETDL